MTKKVKSLISCKELSDIIEGMAKQSIKDIVGSNPELSFVTFNELPVGALLKWINLYEDFEIQKVKEW